MATKFNTDAEVEREIARLQESDDVKLARRERQIQNRKRQYMHTLRWLEKKGIELRESGVTMETLDKMACELDETDATEGRK